MLDIGNLKKLLNRMILLKSKQYFETYSELTTSMVTAGSNIHTLEAFQLLQTNDVINLALK